jgi:hypothetical protein
METRQRKTTGVFLLVACMTVAGVPHPCWAKAERLDVSSAAGGYVKKDTWQQTMLFARNKFRSLQATREQKDDMQNTIWEQIKRDFPIQCDWISQDYGTDFYEWFTRDTNADIEKRIIDKALAELGSEGKKLAADFRLLQRSNIAPDDQRWLDLYVKACERRREIRLQPLLDKCNTIVFTKHYNMGGSHYAYTEGQSDAQSERNFVPGSALCLWSAIRLDGHGIYGEVRTLIDDPDGVIRDPDVSFDGKRILFAWKKSDRQDDYHLYEMEVETGPPPRLASGDTGAGKVRQLTSGLGFADYEGAYLPNDDIIFNSTRCVQTVDCWWTEVSNLYTCDKHGKYLRRLTFDQVHTNFPTVLEDGRLIYTRWEYNDRGQIYPQGLFQMSPDGTGQTEFYGNNSWFPTTIMHARPDVHREERKRSL